MIISNIITMIGGLGMFLFGMNRMGDGLEKAAGARLQKIIETLTGNLLKGILVGTLVTAVIQSSGATTVMVIGFINAGVMTLGQAIGVIMGANIGTTVTAQILRLSDIQGGAWYLDILKPTTIAPVAIAVGVFLMMFTKKKRAQSIGEILAGFGVLFIGMGTMGSAVKDIPGIDQVFAKFGTNPVLGLLAGVGVTALLQSSSASVGILQAVSSTGILTFSAAMPIILGQNIGSCITGLLSAIGATKNAQKAAVSGLLIKIFGTAIFVIVLYAVHAFFELPFWNDVVYTGDIANFHTFFNVATTIVLMPFTKLLVRLIDRMIKSDESEKRPEDLLDDRFLGTPSVAVGQALKAIIEMISLAEQSFASCTELVFKRDKGLNGKLTLLDANEDALDKMESNITNYLVKISEHDLNLEENNTVSGIFHSVTDIERIGDHTANIVDSIRYMADEDIHFSESASKELKTIIDAVHEVILLCIRAYKENDLEAAKRVQPIEAVVDMLKDELRERHIARLTNQECNFNTGIAFLDIINNLERISDHCSNIAMSIEQKLSAHNLDPHQYTNDISETTNAEYQKSFEQYKARYSV